MEENIGQRLLSATTATPLDLRQAGLAIDSVERALRFRWCESPSDFVSTLELRHAAYAATGMIEPDASPTAMGDGFDCGARILMAFHHDRLVGTARVALPSPSELNEYAGLVTLPGWITESPVGVLSRIATDHRYRGSDLLYSLVFRSLAVCRGSRRLVLACTTERLMPIYERVGARATDLVFRHPNLDIDEHVIVFEPEAIANGVGVRADLRALLHRCV